jgi:hypothetical protein
MSQPTEQGATTEGTAPGRPGKTLGQVTEFTAIFPLKPGGADRLRELLKRVAQTRGSEADVADRVGTLHDMRSIIIDNDTRLLFATTFDGDWDTYIQDFSTQIPDQLDALFGECVDYPGIRSPEITDYILKYQLTADDWYSAYPNTTVKQIKKGQRVLQAWEELLDASEE